MVLSKRSFGMSAGAIALALFSSSALAAGHAGQGALEGKGQVRWRSLTPWILDYQRLSEGLPSQMRWDSPDAPDMNEVAVLAGARPTLSGPEVIVETDHAVLHYTLEGDDAASEVQVEAALVAIEESWQKEVSDMGYPAPLTDRGAGGSDKYDFYFKKQLGSYGYTAGETAVDINSRPSYICLNNASWMGEPEVKVTVAHEFFHSIHMTLDYKEDIWWFEVTATWMEDMVYDDINDYYNYLSSAFASPETELDAETSIIYGLAIWAHSLSERYGQQIIQDIWFAASESETPQALEINQAVVEAYGGYWPEVLHSFRESMLDMSRFEEGSAYQEVVGEVDMSGTFEEYPASASGTLTHTGAHMVEFLPPEGEGTLRITLPGTADFVASVYGEESAGKFVEVVPDTPVGAAAVMDVEGFGSSYPRVVMVVTHTGIEGETSDNFSFELIEWVGGGDDDDCSHVPGRKSRGTGASWAVALALVGLASRSLRRRS